MRRIAGAISVAVLSTALLTACHRHTSPLVTIDLQPLGISQRQEFLEVHQKTGLPPAVVKAFWGDIADSGEAYRETDVANSNLPLRRLLVAGISPKYCIVNYERGGLAHSYAAVLFAVHGRDADPIWTAASGSFRSLTELRQAIDSNRLVREPISIP